MKKLSRKMRVRFEEMVKDRNESNRLLHLEDSERPTRKFTIKLKEVDKPVEVDAHSYWQVLDNEWLRFHVNQKDGMPLMIFACRSDDVVWLKGAGY